MDQKIGWLQFQDAWRQWTDSGFGSRVRFFDPGEVRLAVLSLLSEGPKNGYQVMKELQERSGGLYRGSAGSVYPTLTQLEKEKRVRGELQERRRMFYLTASGRQELADEAVTVRRIWERALAWEQLSHLSSPEVMSVASPVLDTIKCLIKAAKWSGGRSDREQKLRTILRRLAKDLDSLTRSEEEEAE